MYKFYFELKSWYVLCNLQFVYDKHWLTTDHNGPIRMYVVWTVFIFVSCNNYITIFRPKLVWQWDICLKKKKNNLIILPSWAEFKLQMYVSQSDLGVYNWDKLHQILVNHEFIFCCFLASNREWYKYILKFNIGEVLEIY